MTPNEQYFLDHVPTHIMSDAEDSNVFKMWKIIAKQFDEIDVMHYQIRQLDDINKQSGVNLDRIGAKIGQTRKGTLDAVYKILLDIATVDEAIDSDFVITNIVKLLRGESVNLENDFPAGVIVKVTNPDPVITFQEISLIIKQLWKFARKYTITIDVGVNAFSFLNFEGKGFDDFNNPGDGGIFSSVIFS